jgi:hypothetical protein
MSTKKNTLVQQVVTVSAVAGDFVANAIARSHHLLRLLPGQSSGQRRDSLYGLPAGRRMKTRHERTFVAYSLPELQFGMCHHARPNWTWWSSAQPVPVPRFG